MPFRMSALGHEPSFRTGQPNGRYAPKAVIRTGDSWRKSGDGVGLPPALLEIEPARDTVC